MRERIVVLAMLAATLATSLFGIPLALFAAHFYRTDEITELERAADTAAIDVAADLFHGRSAGVLHSPAPGISLALYSADGRLLGGHGPPTADPIVAQTLADNTVHHDTRSGQLVAAVPVADGSQVAYAVRATTSTTRVYPRILITWALMLSLEALVLILTWRLARWQARRLARPLEYLSTAAGTLGDGDFSVRTQPSGIHEIDEAGTALNRTAARIGDLVERERAITANASHQLRTPLTGLRLGLEAALDSPHPDHRQAIIDAVATTERLDRTIDDLIALARDTTHATEPLPLDALLTEISDTWASRLAETGRALRISADAGLLPSPASTAAVRQILAVLTDNAARHGVGAVTVHAREASGTTAIDVSDEGTGLRQDEAALFRRRTTSGHGIGLPLARDLAEAEGARLRLSSRTPTTFTLFLPTPTQPPTGN
jgi:signal transduction histidine kinase